MFRTFIEENAEIWNDALKRNLYLICSSVVDHEDAFIRRAFELGPVEGLGPEDVMGYIRYIADRRLGQLGLQPIYRVGRNREVPDTSRQDPCSTFRTRLHPQRTSDINRMRITIRPIR